MTSQLPLFVKTISGCCLQINATLFTESLLKIYIFTKLDYFLDSFVHFFFLYLKIEHTTLRKRRDSLWYDKLSKKKLLAELVDEIQLHGFIQAILMPGRWYKKLNLLIKFSNSIFIFFLNKKKAYWLWTCSQYKSSY